MEQIFDSIVHLKEAGWTEDQAKVLFRRFIPIGTAEEMGKLLSLVKEKSLSREDLTLILRTIALNQGEAHDLAVVQEELQNIRCILEFALIPKHTTKIVDGKHVRVPFDRKEVFNLSEADQG